MKKNKIFLLSMLSLLLAGCQGPLASSVSNSVSPSSPSSSSVSSSASSSASSSSSSSVSSSSAVSSSSTVSSVSSSSSSSSSSSVSQVHAIRKADGIIGGDIAFSQASAEVGTVITVTVTTADGYRFQALSSDQVTLTSVTEGVSYSFVMPDSDVTIQASFQKLYAISSLRNINMPSDFNSTPSNLAVGDKFAAGETITLKIAASNTDYGIYYTRVANATLYVGDTMIHGTYDATAKDSNGCVPEALFPFTMPEGDVSLYLYYDANYYSTTTGHKLTVQADVGVKVFGYDSTRTDYSSIGLSVLRTDGYMVTAQYRLDTATDWQTLDFAFDTTSQSYFPNGIGQLFLYSYQISGDLTIHISSTAVEQKMISYTGQDDVLVTSNGGVLPTNVMPGDAVTLLFKEKDAANYLLPCTITGVTATTNADGNLTFIMPNSDVSIAFNVAAGMPVTFKETSEGSVSNLATMKFRRSASGDANYTTAKAGSTIYLKTEDIVLDSAYGIVGLKMNDGDLVTLSSGYFGSFYQLTMPESGDAEITIVTAFTFSVTMNAVDGVTITLTGSPFVAGSSVRGTFTYTNSLYSLIGFHVADRSGYAITDLAITIDTSSSYNMFFTFTMPSKSIVLTPTVTKTTALNITFDLGDHADLFQTDSTSRSNLVNSSYKRLYFPTSGSDTDPAVFKPGDSYSLNVNLKNAGYDVQAVIADGTTTTTIVPDSVYITESTGAMSASFNNGYKNYTFPATATAVTISFVLTAKAPLTATVVNPDAATLSYKVNGQAVTDLSGVHAGDYLGITTGTAPDGYGYSIVVTESDDGVALTPTYAGNYNVKKNFTISVTKQALYSLTVTDSGNMGFYFQTGAGKALSSPCQILNGTIVKIQAYKACHMTIVAGTETVLDIDVSAYAYQTFTMSDNTVITLTAKA
jgi:hypothetical protein